MSSVDALAEDAVVRWVDCYASGVLWVALVDDRDRMTHVCVDGREESPTRNRLFVGGRHPSKESSILIDRGGADESRVISILRRGLTMTADEDAADSFGKTRVLGEMLERLTESP